MHNVTIDPFLEILSLSGVIFYELRNNYKGHLLYRKGDLHNYMQFVLILNERVNYTTAVNVSYVYEPGTIFRIIVSFLPLPHKQLI